MTRIKSNASLKGNRNGLCDGMLERMTRPERGMCAGKGTPEKECKTQNPNFKTQWTTFRSEIQILFEDSLTISELLINFF
jgi:hypothetical protein